MIDNVWLVPAFPLAGVLINGFFGKWMNRRVVGTIACATVFGSFVVSALVFAELLKTGYHEAYVVRLFTWIPAGDFEVDAAFLVDSLSALMILVVSFVGFWIHVYSAGYMGHDEGFPRYFTYLNLFMLSMLILVLANNFLVLYVGWELVGLCSYLLIGFWYQRAAPAFAAKKAFIVNRVGDFGFALGIMLIFVHFGTLDYASVFEAAPEKFAIGAGAVTAITLLLFMGAAGKSAQIPLHVWLPDAMEGPTPVSALIHAATMVTAGVYMVARNHVLFELAPTTMMVVASIGVLTAFMAATIGLVINDLKRVLAYSTISQLGYMFLATGVGAFAAGIFHLATHAFFKALMFLGAGSVMHALNGEIDMRKMGGLHRHMKWTSATFLIGVLAIAGFPFLSGFFSKDEILFSAFTSHLGPEWFSKALWALAFLTAFLTALYMGRAYFKTFHGESRVEPGVHPHESPGLMVWPLLILAIGSILAGYVGVPHILGGSNLVGRFLAPSVGRVGHVGQVGQIEWTLMALSVVVGILGLLIAGYMYVVNARLPRAIAEAVPGVYRTLANKYYVDEAYHWVFVRGGTALAMALWRGFDVRVIDGLVNGTAWFVAAWSSVLRRFQTGFVRQYALTMLAGLVVLVAYLVYR
jgi:NADH-quinone oxidoreductase subunit L